MYAFVCTTQRVGALLGMENQPRATLQNHVLTRLQAFTHGASVYIYRSYVAHLPNPLPLPMLFLTWSLFEYLANGLIHSVLLPIQASPSDMLAVHHISRATKFCSIVRVTVKRVEQQYELNICMCDTTPGGGGGVQARRLVPYTSAHSSLREPVTVCFYIVHLVPPPPPISL